MPLDNFIYDFILEVKTIDMVFLSSNKIFPLKTDPKEGMLETIPRGIISRDDLQEVFNKSPL